jgi:NCAIR mutase (PurE)-related protein
MDPRRLREVLDRLSRGEANVDSTLELLRALPFEDLGFAKVDHHRSLRLGFPEVILGEFKTPRQVAEIARSLCRGSHNVLVTRVDPAKAREVSALFPELVYDEVSRTLVLESEPVTLRGRGPVAVVSAGTSDQPVAEEACVTLRMLGNEVRRVNDVGVAGIHRVLHHRAALDEASVVIVVAGMDGALASVVGGLVARPVIAVPTSIGYGASFGGLAALLGMLNSCAAGVTVVNIDNGFGAAYAASLMNRREDAPHAPR